MKRNAPQERPTQLARALDATARALGGRGDRAQGVRHSVDYLEKQPAAVFGVMHACAALGDLDASFAILNGYYFGEGAWSKVAPEGGDLDRTTSALFLPPMKPAGETPVSRVFFRASASTDIGARAARIPDFLQHA